MTEKEKLDCKAMYFRNHIRNDDFANMVREYNRVEEADKLFLLTEMDSEGRCPLHIAAEYGFSESVKFLVEEMQFWGQKIDVLTKTGKTALYLACLRGYKYKKSADAPSSIAEYCGTRGHVIEYLLEKKANPNIMQTATEESSVRSTKMTCLHWACIDPNDYPIVKMLRDYDANPFVLNYEGLTPFDIAGQNSTKDQKKSLDVLLNSLVRYWNMNPIENEVLDKLPEFLQGKTIDEKTKCIFTKLDSYDPTKLIYLKLLYWAAFAGNKIVVEKLLGVGISPFLRYLKGENAIMSAIKGYSKEHELKEKQPVMECLKMMIEFNYIARDQDKDYKVFPTGIKETDEDKNTIFHFAAMGNAKLIYDFLFDNPKCVEERNKYNLKGFKASDLIYKEEEYKGNGDYVVIVATKKDLGKIILKQLQKKFNVAIHKSVLPEEYEILALGVSDFVYGSVAEELKIEVELKNHNLALPYDNSVGSHGKYYPLNQKQKHHIIEHLVDTEVDIKSCVRYKSVLCHYPLHSTHTKETLHNLWEHYFFTILYDWLLGKDLKGLIPIFMQASYFGEKNAFFFAFITYYTAFLTWIAVPGLILFIVQMSTGSIDSVFIPLYCSFLSLWITFFNKFWKRHELELAKVWNASSTKSADEEREEYVHEKTIDIRSKEVKKVDLSRNRLRNVTWTTGLIILGLGLIIGIYIGVTYLQNAYLAGVVNGFAIFILSLIYKYFAWFLTNMENHHYKENWDNSYIIKIYAFQFVNSYLSLFAISFIDQSVNSLFYSMASIFITSQILNNFLNFIVPYFIDKYLVDNFLKEFEKVHGSLEEDKEKKRVYEIEESYIKGAPNQPLLQIFLPQASTQLIFAYLDTIIQIGYLTMFSNAFPLAPLLSILANIWVIKGHVRNMIITQRRSIALGAKNIGIWREIIDFLAIITTCINVLVIYFTSTAYYGILESIFGMKQLIIMVYVLVGYEHILLGVKWIFGTAVKEVSKKVVRDEKKIEKLKQDALGNLMRENGNIDQDINSPGKNVEREQKDLEVSNKDENGDNDELQSLYPRNN